MTAMTIEDYTQYIADHNRLVREIDVAVNGANAAQQASLCDILKDVQKLVERKNFVVKHSTRYCFHGNNDKGYAVSYLGNGCTFAARGLSTIDEAIDAAITHYKNMGSL